MSERPTRPTWSFNWRKSLTQYADDMDRWVAELEAESAELKTEAERHTLVVAAWAQAYQIQRDRIAELEAENQRLEKCLNGIVQNTTGDAPILRLFARAALNPHKIVLTDAAREDTPEEETVLCPHCHGCGYEAGHQGLSNRKCKACGGTGEDTHE